MSNKTLKEYLTPPIVLVIICLVVTATLSVVYQLTEPVIAANTAQTQIEAVQEVLPAGTGFEEYAGTVDGSTSFFQSENHKGIAVMATEKSFGGPMNVMVGIDNSGKIVAIKIVTHIDTPGLGTLPMVPEELGQYTGLDTLSGEGTKDSTEIDGVTGATVSSDAIFRATKTALAQWEALSGGDSNGN